MIAMEIITANIVRIQVPKTLKAEDFAQLAPQIDPFIRQHGKIRLLVDASEFDGWENMGAFEKHIGFVKSHLPRVECAAVIANHAWQHWIAGVIKIFVSAEIRIFDKNKANEAMQWVIDTQA